MQNAVCNILSDKRVYIHILFFRCQFFILQDENFVSFIRGGLKIKACYSSYKECSRILHKRKWRSTDEKEQFESGVAMGVGLFNLMVSMMPAKVTNSIKEYCLRMYNLVEGFIN